MIKLLLIEDEQIIREGIEEMIDWEAYGVSLIGSFANGLEAYNRFDDYDPDIVLTDIRMPKMNGLDLIMKAKENGYEFETILLSGYDDFEFAKKGLQLGAIDYLLKPCRPEAILQSVLRAKEKINKSQEKKQSIKTLEQSWSKHLPVIKRRKLLEWMYGTTVPGENLVAQIGELKIGLINKKTHVAIIHIDRESGNEEFESELDHLQEGIIKIAQRVLAPVYDNHFEIMPDGKNIVWCGNCSLQNYNELKTAMVDLQGHVFRQFNHLISIGVGPTYNTLDSLHQSYKEASIVIEKLFFQGKGKVLFYSELQGKAQTIDSSEIEVKLTNIENIIFQCLEDDEYAKASEELENWLSLLRGDAYFTKQKIVINTTSFMANLQKLSYEKDIASSEWEENMKNNMSILSDLESFTSISDMMRESLEEFIKLINTQSNLHKTVRAATRIIQAKYNTNLTLENLAKEVFVSPTYLSSLFKQELGVNYLDYLHQYRIKKAKRLLKQNFKIYAIAKSVGYQDERHFSNTFKKWVGKTPSQYQKK